MPSPTSTPQLRLLGIRHHGPGSARAVAAVLAALKPDCVLIEGPEDAQDAVHLALKPDLVPPVALLVHASDDPKRAVFYPFASFSPEWQAIQYAVHARVPLQWMDLSVSQQMGLEDLQAAKLEAAQLQAATLESAMDAPHASHASDMPDTPHAPDTPNAPHAPPEQPVDTASMPQDFLACEDPLDTLAIAAGYSDGEAFWDEVLETNRARHAAIEDGSDGSDIQAELATFEAITEAMLAVRTRTPTACACDAGAATAVRDLSHHASTPQAAQREALREAQMRQTLRSALAAQYQCIVVVCGAWHTPALLHANAPGYAKADTALLKAAFAGARKVKTNAAWAPWSFDRLALRSGYGAGIQSPAWYQMLWDTKGNAPSNASTTAATTASAVSAQPSPSIVFATAAARLLRESDLEASSASVIETVRLAEQLSALRGRAEPGLEDLLQAIQSVLTQGQPAPMSLIAKQLVVGTRLGVLPDDAPLTPLYADLMANAKRLRLPFSADAKDYDLDLRKANDLARSHLLHRLRLLDIAWGNKQSAQGRAQGSFHEHWSVQWQPEFAVECVLASRLGATIEQAAHASAIARARSTDNVTRLVDLLDELLLADLPGALGECVALLSAAAAASKDTLQMMQAFGRLGQIRRYGSVRQTDGTVLDGVLAMMAVRISIGVVGACFSLDDEAAQAMRNAITSCDAAYQLLDEPAWSADWLCALTQLADQNDGSPHLAAPAQPAHSLHGLVAGLCARLVYNRSSVQVSNHVDADADADADADDALATVLATTQQRMARALSQGYAPAQTAAWIQGFNSGNASALLHDDALWRLIHAWLGTLSDDYFIAVLPLLRRSFSLFALGERHALADKANAYVRLGERSLTGQADGLRRDIYWNEAAAAAVLPALRLLFEDAL